MPAPPPDPVPRYTGPNGRCLWCGGYFHDLTRDHVVPQWAKGSDDPANIVPACKPCNQDRGQVVEFATMASRAREGRLGPERVARLRVVFETEVRDRLALWADKEEAVLGFSPSLQLDLSLPPEPEPPPFPPDPADPVRPPPDPDPAETLAWTRRLAAEMSQKDHRRVLANALAESERERHRLAAENDELKAALSGAVRPEGSTAVTDDDAEDDLIPAADVFGRPPPGDGVAFPPGADGPTVLHYDPPQEFRVYVFPGAELRLEAVVRVAEHADGTHEVATADGRAVAVSPKWLWLEYKPARPPGGGAA